MTPEESEWLGEQLINLTKSENIHTLLNVGSSTKHFREVEQPAIYENIFKPLLQHNIKVDHLDIKDAEGVDIVGDLSDAKFLERLKQLNYQAILCTNLLEHVVNPKEICEAMLEVVQKYGFIIVGVPKVFPYHNDPIDTMLRLNIEELSSYFKNTEMIEGKEIVLNRSHFNSLTKNPRLFVITVGRILTPFYKFGNWKKIVSGLPSLFKKYEITYVILRKN